MTNTNLLKSKMIASGDGNFVKKLSEILGISEPTASNKLNDKMNFTQTEIIKIVTYYKMTPEEVVAIFLDDDAIKEVMTYGKTV